MAGPGTGAPPAGRARGWLAGRRRIAGAGSNDPFGFHRDRRFGSLPGAVDRQLDCDRIGAGRGGQRPGACKAPVAGTVGPVAPAGGLRTRAARAIFPP